MKPVGQVRQMTIPWQNQAIQMMLLLLNQFAKFFV
jgi:hypothetical protein